MTEFPTYAQARSVRPVVAFGCGLAILISILAICAPVLAPFDAFKMAVGPRLSAPSTVHLFGTDEFGRDLFSRVLIGSRFSLGIGLVAVGFGLFVGGILGFAAAFSGQYVETLILRLIDILYSFPDILIAMVMLAFLGPGIENATFAVGASFVPFYARMIYALSVGEKAKPYLEAARLAGIGPFRLIRVHVMPNISQSVVAVATLGFSSAILSSAGLSFLGLGVQPPSPEWGAILASGRNYITKAPWLLLCPGLAIGLTVFSFQIAVDGMHDLFDPRRKFR